MDDDYNEYDFLDDDGGIDDDYQDPLEQILDDAENEPYEDDYLDDLYEDDLLPTYNVRPTMPINTIPQIPVVLSGKPSIKGLPIQPAVPTVKPPTIVPAVPTIKAPSIQPVVKAPLSQPVVKAPQSQPLVNSIQAAPRPAIAVVRPPATTVSQFTTPSRLSTQNQTLIQREDTINDDLYLDILSGNTPANFQPLNTQNERMLPMEPIQLPNRPFAADASDLLRGGPGYQTFRQLTHEYITNQYQEDMEENLKISGLKGEDLMGKGIAMFIDESKTHDEICEGEGSDCSCIVTIQKDSPLNMTFESSTRKKVFYDVSAKKNVGIGLIFKKDALVGQRHATKENTITHFDQIMVDGSVLGSNARHVKVILNCTAARFQELYRMGALLVKWTNLIARERLIILYQEMYEQFLQSSELFRSILNMFDKKVGPVRTNPNSEFFNRLTSQQPPWDSYGNLNSSQQEAVTGSLTAQNFFMVHGPPGTGKSETLTVILEALALKKLRVVVCSEANNPVDNLLTKFAKTKTFIEQNLKAKGTVIRLGHSALISEDCKKYSLNDAVRVHMKNFGGESVREVQEEVIHNARFVFSTQCALFRDVVRKHFTDPLNMFDYAIVDEASQSFLGFTMMAIGLAKRIIFAGDHKQLSACIKYTKQRGLFERSMFERLFELSKELGSKDQVYKMLDIQYRMNKLLMDTSSKQYYENKVKTGEQNKSILLRDLNVSNGEYIPNNQPLIWIDQPGYEEEKKAGEYINKFEAKLLNVLLKDLIGRMKLNPEEIGVITSYNSQKQHLVETIGSDPYFKDLKTNVDNLLISTVDSFQGREKQVIIFASTRANYKGNVGFLDEHKRFNVAITRAKRCLIFVGCVKTLTSNMRLPSPALYLTALEKGRVMHWESETSSLTVKDDRFIQIELKRMNQLPAIAAQQDNYFNNRNRNDILAMTGLGSLFSGGKPIGGVMTRDTDNLVQQTLFSSPPAVKNLMMEPKENDKPASTTPQAQPTNNPLTREHEDFEVDEDLLETAKSILMSGNVDLIEDILHQNPNIRRHLEIYNEMALTAQPAETQPSPSIYEGTKTDIDSQQRESANNLSGGRRDEPLPTKPSLGAPSTFQQANLNQLRTIGQATSAINQSMNADKASPLTPNVSMAQAPRSQNWENRVKEDTKAETSMEVTGTTGSFAGKGLMIGGNKPMPLPIKPEYYPEQEKVEPKSLQQQVIALTTPTRNTNILPATSLKPASVSTETRSPPVISNPVSSITTKSDTKVWPSTQKRPIDQALEQRGKLKAQSQVIPDVSTARPLPLEVKSQLKSGQAIANTESMQHSTLTNPAVNPRNNEPATSEASELLSRVELAATDKSYHSFVSGYESYLGLNEPDVDELVEQALPIPTVASKSFSMPKQIPPQNEEPNQKQETSPLILETFAFNLNTKAVTKQAFNPKQVISTATSQISYFPKPKQSVNPSLNVSNNINSPADASFSHPTVYRTSQARPQHSHNQTVDSFEMLQTGTNTSFADHSHISQQDLNPFSQPSQVLQPNSTNNDLTFDMVNRVPLKKPSIWDLPNPNWQTTTPNNESNNPFEDAPLRSQAQNRRVESPILAQTSPAQAPTGHYSPFNPFDANYSHRADGLGQHGVPPYSPTTQPSNNPFA